MAKSQKRLTGFTFTFHFHALEKEMAPHSSVLAWRLPGTGERVGCRLWGRTEWDMTDATWKLSITTTVFLSQHKHSVFQIYCCHYAAAAAKSLQSCPTLCDPIDGSPSGSTVSGILQARTLEWVAISFSNALRGKVNVKSLSHV